jgi:hypothetical protein
MNQNSQLGLHPDAESLNAFAEQALAEREREQILAHLAACSRCRQIVCLAQAAAAEQETAAEAPKARSAVWPGAWLRSWRIAWVPVAVLAAIVTLAVFVHQRRMDTGSKLARIEPQAAPQNVGNLAKPSTPLQKAETAPLPVPVRSAAKSLNPTAPAVASEPLPQHFSTSAPHLSQAASIELPNSGHELAALPPDASNPEALTHGVVVQFKPEAAVSARELQLALGTAQSHAAARAMPSARGSETQGRRILASTAPAQQYETKAAILGPIEVSRQSLMAGIPSIHLTKTTALPSGLPAVSTAISRHCVLAIDQAGELFQSEDFGGHWAHVDRQWTGRAVTVHLRSNKENKAADPTGAGVEQSESASGAEVISLSAATFELVNEDGKVWVSRDGKTWKLK